MSFSQKRLSKFLSLVLRHRPEEIGVELEPGGWVSVGELVEKSRKVAGAPITEARIRKLVETQGKPRFSLSGDGKRIRANYGHSIEVDLDLEASSPPPTLYHGTAERTVRAILAEGLRPGSRQHVHLSRDVADARAVGRRHGSPRILEIRADRMTRDGYRFYRAAVGIWLTPSVPPRYLELTEE